MKICINSCGLRGFRVGWKRKGGRERRREGGRTLSEGGNSRLTPAVTNAMFGG